MDVTVETKGPVSIIRINRPDRLNAINNAVAKGIQQAFQEFDRSDQRVAILSGVGARAFTGGADVSDLPELWRAIPDVGFRTDKPIVAAVSGWCIGGGIVIAMMCDLMVATESAVFYYPEGKLGVTGGMISSLASRMPHKLAMEVMLLGRKVGARRAYEVGFVNEVVVDGEHENAALAMAQELCGMAPLVLATLKRFVNDMVLPTGPVEQSVNVNQAIARVRTSADMAEGIAAFKEKRPAVFKGE